MADPKNSGGNFAMMPHRVSEDENLSDEGIRLLLALIRYAKGKGTCTPTNPELSRATGGKSARQLQRTFADLEGSGYVRIRYADDKHRVRLGIDLIHPALPGAVGCDINDVGAGCDTSVVHATEMTHGGTTETSYTYDRNDVQGTTEMSHPYRKEEEERIKTPLPPKGGAVVAVGPQGESESPAATAAPDDGRKLPADFEALCREADRYGFGPALRAEWWENGWLRMRFEEIPAARVWRRSFDAFATGKPEGSPLKYYLGAVRKSLRAEPVESVKPEPAAARERQIITATRHPDRPVMRPRPAGPRNREAI